MGKHIEEFEAFMADRFGDSIDRNQCLNGDGSDYMAWDMQVAKIVWMHVTAKLEAADERSIACVNAFEGIETERFAGKSIGEFLAGEVRLNKAEPKPDGSFGFTFSGLAIQIMAEAFADQFKSSGAVNYLELLFEHSEIGPLTVTMQRVEGLTPVQKLTAAEECAEAAEARLLVPEGYCIMPESLTAENGAKGALSGEFFTEKDITCEECGGDRDEDDPCEYCNDLGVQTVRSVIGWSTIKDIYKMAVDTTAIRAAGFKVEGE